MVTTRRQSGKLPLPLAAVSVEDLEDEGDIADSAVKSSASKGRRSLKRAKVNETYPKKTSTTRKRTRANLISITDMPLDILFEIFGYLEPSNLLSLSRTNKLLQKILLSKKAIVIWKVALPARNIPTCLEEPQWEDLLFGGASHWEVIKSRLTSIGHVDIDINDLARSLVVCSKIELTGQAWDLIRPIMESEVNRRKMQRLARERKLLLDSRQQVARQMYSDYKRTVVPMEWAYHPHDSHVIKFTSFAALIDNPSYSHIEPRDCHAALQKLPDDINAFNEKKRRLLADLLLAPIPPSETMPWWAGSLTAKDIITAPTALDCVNLATSVFQCSAFLCESRQGPLVGGQSAICHSCPPTNLGYECASSLRHAPQESIFHFSDRGSKAVQSLATLLDLDIRNATPADFDRRAARFTCLHCPTLRYQGILGRAALTWQECVTHLLDPAVDIRFHWKPRWQMLTSEEALDVKQRERSEHDPADSDRAWSCNHCSTHLNDWASRDIVVQHVIDSHGTIVPVEDVDFFYDQQRRRTPRRPVFFGVNAPKGSADAKRLFNLAGITAHLKSKHNITIPLMNRDMTDNHLLDTFSAGIHSKNRIQPTQ